MSALAVGTSQREIYPPSTSSRQQNKPAGLGGDVSQPAGPSLAHRFMPPVMHWPPAVLHAAPESPEGFAPLHANTHRDPTITGTLIILFNFTESCSSADPPDSLDHC
jgi:hypothetical protein